MAVVPVVLAYGYLAVISILLGVIDARTHRLPNRIVLPAYPILVALYTLACVLGHPWPDLLRAAIGGVALFAFYALLRALPGGGMGGGDVKLAGVVGIALGFAGWAPLIVGTVAGFLLGGLYGIALLGLRRATRATRIPFGPFLIAGAWIGIVFGGPFATGFLGTLPVG